MVRLASLFHHIHPKRILVAGDFMLDSYLFGKTKRISPEAPVPVVLVENEEAKAGGAGNVVLNLISLGMEVIALGRVGEDAAGYEIRACLAKERAQDKLFTQNNFKTPKKTRVIASSQQLLRVDKEEILPLDLSLEKQVIAEIPDIVKNCDLVAVSDYAKGFLTDGILKALIQAAKTYNIPLIADPKGDDFTKYSGATVIKPNLSEAYAAAKLSSGTLEVIAKKLFEHLSIDVLMVTRSEKGISLYFPDGSSEDHPVHAKAIRDVTGAGDTVLAVVSAAIANKLSFSEAVDLANIAASIAVEQVGCARVTLSEIARRLIEQHRDNKIFSDEQLPAFKAALHGEKVTVLDLKKGSEVNTKLLRAIRELSKKNENELVVSVEEPDDELVQLLASLKEVDFIHISPDQSLSSYSSHIYEYDGEALKKR